MGSESSRPLVAIHTMKIFSGSDAGHLSVVESDVYQRTVDYPDEFNDGYHVMLDGEEPVTDRSE